MEPIICFLCDQDLDADQSVIVEVWNKDGWIGVRAHPNCKRTLEKVQAVAGGELTLDITEEPHGSRLQ